MAHCTDDSSLRARPPARPDDSAAACRSERVAHYTLERKLGDGRMGPLYLAQDTELKRLTALRLISDRLAADPKFMARLDQNIRAASKLHHASIAVTYGAGVDPGRGRVFITTEFCPGEPLSVILARCGRLEFRDALNLGIQVCRALSYMHSRAIIHGEIKPSNVILDPCGAARVLDCGLPTSGNMTETASTTSTQTGKSLGASQYISPEAVRGEKLDVRADVYSVGAMLFHLMTGENPFCAPDIPTLVLKQLYEEPRNAHAVHACVPESVAAVLSKTMAKSPDERYVDCAELLEEFERVREGRPASQRLIPVKPTADANEKSKLIRSGFSQKLMAVLKNFQF